MEVKINSIFRAVAFPIVILPDIILWILDRYVPRMTCIEYSVLSGCESSSYSICQAWRLAKEYLYEHLSWWWRSAPLPFVFYENRKGIELIPDVKFPERCSSSPGSRSWCRKSSWSDISPLASRLRMMVRVQSCFSRVKILSVSMSEVWAASPCS